jgi:hypothetical protein
MVRVSEHYGISASQASLEFVDVDIRNDSPLFIDPTALRLIETALTRKCTYLIQSFFGHVLELTRDGDSSEAQRLLGALGELNETRLGFSTDRARGSGMGPELGRLLWTALSTSRAAATGVLEDLEEATMFIDNIGPDRVSDLITNIIRGPLTRFTNDMAVKYGIPQVDHIIGYEWNPRTKTWDELNYSLPVADGKPLILVPRMFVHRIRATFDPDQYYRHAVIPYIQNQHLAQNSSLVRLLKHNVRKPPFKKTLIGIHPDKKGTNIEITREAPGVKDSYRQDAEQKFEVISQADLATGVDVPPPDFDQLLQDVLDVPPGRENATRYHHAGEKLLTALFYPALDMPVIELELHEGRKRIDIGYTNIARKGFFHWLHSVQGVVCAQIPVEAKNYSNEIANEEFDQLTGRFGVQRGFVGILIHRGFSDKTRVINRARDAAHDGRGYVIPLDDNDLSALVEERKQITDGEEFTYLWEIFRRIVS